MILAINGGSSSIKFALFKAGNSLEQLFNGEIENIGTNKAKLNFNNTVDQQKNSIDFEAADQDQAANHLIDWLEKQAHFASVKAIGHRIVHGMKHTKPELISDDLLNELKKISAFDPEHLPQEIKLIEVFSRRRPALKQIACFDTAFHTTIPPVAKTFAIPKKYYNEGVQRYGFHGISYSYLMQELRKQNETEANGKIILAHLGSGASIAAAKGGKCIDTSMGFTPAGGIVMSTRSGDLDPGVAWYLMQQGMDAEAFNNLINHQSGLLGISGLSADMKVLLQHEKENKDAALAIDIFCYQIKKYIGAYTAALRGLDTLVFIGGIGENAPVIRSRVCAGFEYGGIRLNEDKNNKNEWLISDNDSNVKVYVIPTNEELMIANFVNNILEK